MPMNHCLARAPNEVLGAALAVAVGGGEAGAGEAGGGEAGGCDGCGGGGAAAVPATAAGACGGGDCEPVKPVNDEQPANAVSAIRPAMVLRKLRHSLPSPASGRPRNSPAPE